jgi:hypothetical protein
MGFSLACPISGEQRDNNTVRVVAAESLIVAATAVLIALLGDVRVSAVITGLLAADFIIRAFVKPKYSPLATLARGLTSALNVKKKMVDNAPKVFAARVGVAFTVTATVLLALGLTTPGAIVLGVLIIFAFLESAFSFCAGCWMYALFPEAIRVKLSKEFWSAGDSVSDKAKR